jgi:hypothetical protein
LVDAPAGDGVLVATTDLPGGGTSTPRTMPDARTTEVLVHTWNLARATGLPQCPARPSMDAAVTA